MAKRKTLIGASAIFTCSLLLACVPAEHTACASFKTKHEYLEIDLRKAKNVRYPRINISVFAEIEHCYNKYPYHGKKKYAILFGQESILPNGRVLIFAIYGVSDVEFAVLVDDSYRVIRTGLFKRELLYQPTAALQKVPLVTRLTTARTG